MSESRRCPECGYTKEDAAIHMDHHLCKGNTSDETNRVVAAMDRLKRECARYKRESAIAAAKEAVVEAAEAAYDTRYHWDARGRLSVAVRELRRVRDGQ